MRIMNRWTSSVPGPGIDFTAREIDLLAAAGTDVFAIELVGKYFFFFAAFRAFAGEHLEIFQIVVTRAVLWCRHDILLVYC